MIIGFVTAGNRGCLMRQYLIIERIQQNRPFPGRAFMLEYGHVWHNNFQWPCSIPVSFDLIRELYALFSGLLVSVLSCFGMNSTNSLICPLITSSLSCTIFSDMVYRLLSEWCVPTSFYQRSANHVSFYAFFNLRNLLYLINYPSMIIALID